MDDLLLHPKVRESLEQLVKGNAHAILLKGEQGAGKQTAARNLAAKLLGLANISSLVNAPYFLTITSDGKSVGIELVREIQKFVQLKTTGTNDIRRVVIVQSADTMTIEAQNALLKILEEPPADTVIILTAHQPQKLRPTIHSRVQTVSLAPPTKSDIEDYFVARNHTLQAIERAYTVSNGQVGLLSALLDNSEGHALATQISVAKKLYGMSAFERLAKVDEIAKQKDELPDLLFACRRICITALEQAAIKGQAAAVKTWHRQLKLICDTENTLKSNPNTKLLLTDLFLNI